MWTVRCGIRQRSWQVHWNQAIIEEGITDVHLTGEILKGLFGKTMDVIARNILPEATEEQRERILERCCRYEHEALAASEEDITYPQVIEVIRTLAERYPLFIVSNCQSGYIELFLEKTGLGKFCDRYGMLWECKNVQRERISEACR